MTAPGSRTRSRLPNGSTHRFGIGQMVTMKGRYALAINPADLFRITATLPVRDNSPQYRIRNEHESHERVATEDSLDLVPEGSAEGDQAVFTAGIFPPLVIPQASQDIHEQPVHHEERAEDAEPKS